MELSEEHQKHSFRQTSPIPQSKSSDYGKNSQDKHEATMRAVFLEDYGKPLIIKEIPIPKPSSGEVLIKMSSAPINPSDLEVLKGVVPEIPNPPFQVGIEGAGTVISGKGLMARTLVGKRVAFAVQPGKLGTWAQYVVAPAMLCFPLEKNMSFEQGACGTINPFTAVAFGELIKKEKHKGVILNAAASQLGRMLNRVFKHEGVNVINVVRKPDQVKLLEDIGAESIFNSESFGFEEELRKKAAEIHANCLLEPVCGETTHKLIRALPSESTCYIYGHLSKDKLTNIDFTDLLTQNKTIKSFQFNLWLNSQGIFTKLGVVRKVHKMLVHDLRSVIAKSFYIEEINEALNHYTHHMSEGKVLIKPYDHVEG